jgi:alpha/beta superfamily hydrolase
METSVHFGAAGFRLEGRLLEREARAVVVTHPHPLYGGSMDNPVVAAIAAGYQRTGYTTLRFNFRGVEGSQGAYGEGRGEQEDVRQAIEYLREAGYGPIELSGYSFGAWVNAHHTAACRKAIPMTMVAPPVALMDFRDVGHLPGLVWVVAGSRDEIAPPEQIRHLLPRWNPRARLKVLSGADHFFFDAIEGLTTALEAALKHPPAAHTP